MAEKVTEKVLFKRPEGLTDTPFTYCSGCAHGTVHRLVAESLDDLGLTGNAVGIAPVGCSVTAYNFFNCDMAQAAHGRAPAVGTGIKRARPDSIVFAYQGDGDLAAIGTAETVHAAARGEHITVIFINNAIYGMTGGQMAPTTLPEQVTQTSPYGRDTHAAGYPIRVVEMLSQLDGVALAQRVTVDTPKNIRAAKRAIRKAFEYQRDGVGYTIIEVVCTCPTNWGLDPREATAWMQENMLPYYPLGVFRDVKADGFGSIAEAAEAHRAELAETAAAATAATAAKAAQAAQAAAKKKGGK